MAQKTLENARERYLVGLVPNEERACEMALQFVVKNLLGSPRTSGVISAREWDNVILNYLIKNLRDKGFRCVMQGRVLTIDWGAKKSLIRLHKIHQGLSPLRGMVFGWAVIADLYSHVPSAIDERVKCSKTDNPQILSFQLKPKQTAVIL